MAAIVDDGSWLSRWYTADNERPQGQPLRTPLARLLSTRLSLSAFDRPLRKIPDVSIKLIESNSEAEAFSKPCVVHGGN